MASKKATTTGATTDDAGTSGDGSASGVRLPDGEGTTAAIPSDQLGESTGGQESTGATTGEGVGTANDSDGGTSTTESVAVITLQGLIDAQQIGAEIWADGLYTALLGADLPDEEAYKKFLQEWFAGAITVGAESGRVGVRHVDQADDVPTSMEVRAGTTILVDNVSITGDDINGFTITGGLNVLDPVGVTLRHESDEDGVGDVVVRDGQVVVLRGTLYVDVSPDGTVEVASGWASTTAEEVPIEARAERSVPSLGSVDPDTLHGNIDDLKAPY